MSDDNKNKAIINNLIIPPKLEDKKNITSKSINRNNDCKDAFSNLISSFRQLFSFNQNMNRINYFNMNQNIENSHSSKKLLVQLNSSNSSILLSARRRYINSQKMKELKKNYNKYQKIKSGTKS